MPKYISPVDIAEKWGISIRRVTLLCERGRIPGAYKVGANWIIPADAEKPTDPRRKKENEADNKRVLITAQTKDVSNSPKDYEKMSAPFQALISNAGQNYQFYDLLPIPIEIFAPDGTCIFLNRAMMELNKIPDMNLLVGLYNIKTDPVMIEIFSKEYLERVFGGEGGSYSGFPVPIQDFVDRGITNEKPYEAATMDLFCLPLWDGDIFTCSIVFFTVKNMYEGRKDIAKSKDYIKANWKDEFDIDKIAQSANLSKRHFQRIFKDISGKTPLDYYKEIKIEKIMEKLLDSNLSVEEAFEACGVDSHGAYFRLFKEKTKMSPTEYRKKMGI